MRKLSNSGAGALGLVISGGFHAAAASGLVVWLSVRGATGDAAPRPPVVIEVVPRAIEPAPIDVQFLEAQATRAVAPSATTPRVPTTAPVRRAPRTAAIGTGRSAGTELVPGREPLGPRPTTGPRSKYFDMRAGARLDLTTLPGGFRDDLDHAPAGTAPVRGPESTGALQPSGGGTHKSHQDVFVAKVARDGTVSLADTRNLSAELSWNPAKLLSGRFDVTDWAMRSTGNDPYASRKLAFLDATRDERVEIGRKYRAQQLRETARIVRKNLERAWRTTTDVAQRKQSLFELWDDIAEPAGDDELMVEAARAARTQVIGFIRARLPQGGAHAFTAEELVACNRQKHSKATFAPYE